jgi:L-malate glycosyltransferase
MEISQILPSITTGDAVSNECLRMQETLKANGFTSNIYAEHIDSRLASRVISHKKYVDSVNKILIFHYSIGSELTAFVKSLKSKKVMRYHNITPSEYFISYNDQLAYLCNKGRMDLRIICNDFVMSIADSEYNRNELVELGYKNVEVLPVMTDPDRYNHVTLNQNILLRLSGKKNIVFVGKLAPNKAQKDLIRCFYYYTKYIEPDSYLILVGSYDGFEKYYRELLQMVRSLGLNNVILTGKVSFNDLESYYKCADLFLCMSDHEGFCVPIIEAMRHHIPIMAYNSTAIPYTLGDSGILVNDKNNHIEIAEMANEVICDQSLRVKLIKGQDKKLKEYDEKRLEEKFTLMIENLIKNTRKVPS